MENFQLKGYLNSEFVPDEPLVTLHAHLFLEIKFIQSYILEELDRSNLSDLKDNTWPFNRILFEVVVMRQDRALSKVLI